MASPAGYLCIDGIIKADAKKIAKYAFRDELIFFKGNIEERKFDLWVSDSVSQAHINDFLLFWNKKNETWRIMVIPSDSEIHQEKEYDDNE